MLLEKLVTKGLLLTFIFSFFRRLEGTEKKIKFRIGRKILLKLIPVYNAHL